MSFRNPFSRENNEPQGIIEYDPNDWVDELDKNNSPQVEYLRDQEERVPQEDRFFFPQVIAAAAQYNALMDSKKAWDTELGQHYKSY